MVGRGSSAMDRRAAAGEERRIATATARRGSGVEGCRRGTARRGPARSSPKGTVSRVGGLEPSLTLPSLFGSNAEQRARLSREDGQRKAAVGLPGELH